MRKIFNLKLKNDNANRMRYHYNCHETQRSKLYRYIAMQQLLGSGGQGAAA
jgi:hypothetical protein